MPLTKTDNALPAADLGRPDTGLFHSSAGSKKTEIEPDWRDVPPLSFDDIDQVIRQRFGRLISDAMRRSDKGS